MWTFVGKMMSLLFNTLSRFVIALHTIKGFSIVNEADVFLELNLETNGSQMTRPWKNQYWFYGCFQHKEVWLDYEGISLINVTHSLKCEDYIV